MSPEPKTTIVILFLVILVTFGGVFAAEESFLQQNAIWYAPLLAIIDLAIVFTGVFVFIGEGFDE
jgi:hypothetical protein